MLFPERTAANQIDEVIDLLYSQRDKDRAIQEAFASARMEGFQVTPATERNVRLILDGKLTVEDRVRQIKAEQKRKQG